MKSNIIINGDSLVELNKLEENSIDLIFADPPYWMRTEGILKRVEGTDFDGCDDDWDQLIRFPFRLRAFHETMALCLQESVKTKRFNMGYWRNAMYLYDWLHNAGPRILDYK